MAWAELGEGPRSRAETIRGPQGEAFVLDGDDFVESAFTRGVLTPLSADDVRAYLAPYPTRESRRPLLQWARSLPLDGEPADVAAPVEGYGSWLGTSAGTPKLLLTFDSSPTLLVDEAMARWCAENIVALEIRYCGPAGHHAPEDRPDAIAAAISSWMRERLAHPGAA